MRRRRARRQLTLAAVVSLTMACLIHGFAPSGSIRHGHHKYRTDVILPVSLPCPHTTFLNPQTARRRRAEPILSAASAGEQQEQESTLYDILGASPTDSYQTLRRKYTALARQMHPDTMNANATTDTAEFTQLVAAWRILANPKERLKYDRSLKAREFTNNMGLFIEKSIETAIPILKKTANTTSRTIAEIGKVSQRMEVVMDILDLDRQSLVLEQQATKETLQAKKLKDEIANINDKKLAKLQNVNLKLSSTEALRILDSFDIVNYNKDITRKEIQSLQSTEQEYKERQRLVSQQVRNTKTAERNVASALQREQLAQERLQAAQLELAAAQDNKNDSLLQQKDATAKEKAAMSELSKTLLSLDKTVEKVRLSLQKRQEESLQRVSTNLQTESNRLEEQAKKLQQEALKLKTRAEKIKEERGNPKQ